MNPDDLSPDFLNAGWDMVDLDDAMNVLNDWLDYMDEQGYM